VRILFYEPAADWSGRVRAFHDGGRALAARGYEVLYAVTPGSELQAHCEAQKLPTVALDGDTPAPLRARALRRVITGFYADVVFVHGQSDHLVAAMAVRLAGRASVVRRVEWGRSPALGRRTWLARRVAPITWLLTGVDRRGPWGVPPQDGSARGDLGVHAEPEPPPADVSPRLACVATRRARHRASHVLRAVALLAERHPGLTLALSGTAASMDELRLHTAALGMAGRVRWHGGDAAAAVRGARLAWVIGDFDDAAFGCLDAMAAGVPVLAEQNEVTARLVTPGTEGELFAILEPAHLAAVASDYLTTPGRSAAAGRAAHRRVRNEFTERELANGFEHAARAAREAERTRMAG
jgi:hypothetical protein